VAKQVEQIIIGVDVAKHWIDLYRRDTDTVERIDNQADALVQALAELPRPAVMAVEATNTFHELIVEKALEAGIEVYIIDGYQLSRYRDAVRQRAKTDATDAELLARFVAAERASLVPFRPRDARLQRLWRLLKRRATLVKTHQQLRQSLADIDELKAQVRTLSQHLQRLIGCIERQLLRLARQLNCQALLACCQSLPGVGPLTALALVATYRRGQFSGADAFIAFIGLDVIVKDSGQRRGRRKLSKKGDPEIRRLLHCAAMSAARSTTFNPLYQSLRARGLATTEAYVIIARKLARIAFSLMTNNTHFDPNWKQNSCLST